MWILIGVLFSGVVILAVVLLLMSPGVPAPVTDENGTVIPGSLSEKVFVDINGSRQGMFIISSSLDNPVLLIVHGGMPEYFLTDQYPVGLEQAFTVVWWEQRGIGISYDDDIPRESLTARQSIEDTIAVTRYLLERFDKDKIYLMAHSGGTFFAIQAAAQAPELYHAYIGVAQFAYQIQSEMMAYDYMLAQYRQMGNHKMVRKLLDAPVSMETGTPAGYQAIRDVAMHELGIGTTRDMHSIVNGLFLPSFTFRGYTLAEKFNFWRGKIRNGISVMWEEALYIDMRQQVPSLEIPVYFFGGVHDYTCNTDLAKTYFEALQAPVKGFYLFAHSAHSPHFEEPQKTLEIMLADVLHHTNTLADEK